MLQRLAMAARTGRSRSEGRLRNGLVVGQLAMATTLLIGAALLIASFVRLADIVTIVRRTGSIEGTREAARLQAMEAKQCLNSLKPSRYRDLLLDLCLRSVERST